MKKIGILARPITTGDRIDFKLNGEIKNIVQSYGYLPQLLLPYHYHNHFMSQEEKLYLKRQLNECEGVILQGGDTLYSCDLYLGNYLRQMNIPTLGICLGMQTMAGGNETRMIENKIKVHYDKRQEKFAHEIKIHPNSKLYSILKEEYVSVNSRHHDEITNTNLFVSAYSIDGVVEAIEDENCRFFLGVQWHPETSFAYNEVSKKLFDAFFDAVGGKNETE